MLKTLFDRLELSETATDEEIKRAFRNLSKRHHPDIGGDPEVMREILDAYAILINPTSRELYTGEDDEIFKEWQDAADILFQMKWGDSQFHKNWTFNSGDMHEEELIYYHGLLAQGERICGTNKCESEIMHRHKTFLKGYFHETHDKLKKRKDAIWSAWSYGPEKGLPETESDLQILWKSSDLSLRAFELLHSGMLVDRRMNPAQISYIT